MDTDYYIVMVQDIGELLEYEFSDYAKAAHFMEVEALPCSLWACSYKSGVRIQLDCRMVG